MEVRTLDGEARKRGFNNQQEMTHILSMRPITAPNELETFVNWDMRHGTKDELLALIDRAADAADGRKRGARP